MGLNETLNRLAREREAQENNNTEALSLNKVRDYAERIFFEKMLKEINHGMSEETIKERIDRSITIARLLYNKLKA